jgi:hypothetical protein
MKVTVAGWYSPKTEQMLLNAQAALTAVDRGNRIEWVSGVHEMIDLGIVHTPALLINTNVKVAGRVSSINEITQWIEQELVEELTD